MNLKRATSMFLIVIMCVCFSLVEIAHAEIRSTIDLYEIKNEILSSAKDTLVIFDIDMVLIMPADSILLKKVNGESKPFLKEVRSQCDIRHCQAKCDKFESIILQSRRMKTVTNDTAKIFREIQSQGYKILGLTLSKTGNFGNVTCVEQLRVEELKKLGFTFNQEFPAITPGRLDKYIAAKGKNIKQRRCSPCAMSGIVFTCHAPKGVVLDAYLAAIKMKPSKIIFIDDRMDNLITVASYCAAESITYLGYEYNAVKEIAVKFPLDLELAGLQFAILEQFNIWLSDAQTNAIFRRS